MGYTLVTAPKSSLSVVASIRLDYTLNSKARFVDLSQLTDPILRQFYSEYTQVPLARTNFVGELGFSYDTQLSNRWGLRILAQYTRSLVTIYRDRPTVELPDKYLRVKWETYGVQFSGVYTLSRS